MILIGIGANLTSATAGSPYATCKAALAELAAGPSTITIKACSPWFRSSPVPVSDQPWFVNAVVELATALDPPTLLARLHEVEDVFGRHRSVRNGARVLDLDLLAYDDLILPVGPGPGPQLPHPRLHERAFVLIPLNDLAPDWRHPILGSTAVEMMAEISTDQLVERLSDN